MFTLRDQMLRTQLLNQIFYRAMYTAKCYSGEYVMSIADYNEAELEAELTRLGGPLE